MTPLHRMMQALQASRLRLRWVRLRIGSVRASMSCTTRVIGILLFCTLPAFAGRGGHVTKFDPNIFGGASNVVCLTAAVAGTCSAGFNATCDGIADDTTAWNSFIDYAISHDPIVLYLAPGQNCQNPVNGFLLSKPGPSAHVDGTPIKNLTIWGYGATFNSLWIGTQNVPFPDNTHQALLNTTSAGSSAVTLKSVGDASLFT